METLEQITTKIDELNARAQELLTQSEADHTKAAEFKALIESDIKPQLETLMADRETAIQAEETKALNAEVTSLKAAIEDLRKPSAGFAITASGKALEDDNPYAPGSGNSYFLDLGYAKKGIVDAIERLGKVSSAFADAGYRFGPEGKAMTEGTSSQGGYLVQPLIERQLVLAREKDNVVRGLCSTLNVTTTSIELQQLGLTSTAGWVAELGEKSSETEMTTATVTASVFTMAALAFISNQLLADSNPAIDQLLTADFAKRLVALEETAFLSGSGSGQPLGILNTGGVGTVTNTNTELVDPAVAGGLLDCILEAIAKTQEAWGQPSAIVMHPRTWTRIIKSRNSQGAYTINPGNSYGAPYDPTTPRTYITGPTQTLFGVQVVLSNRIPTNLGSGTNESRVIVADFTEALILDRQGITIDESPHVAFTTNQTAFRAEARLGFTAARAPKAFTIVGGTGLAGG